MKDQRFFIAVKGIDDDLISEAAECKPEKISGKDTDESVGVRFSSAAGKRRVRIWKYPVAAAALLGVMGGALFVINDNGVISDNLTTKEETVGTAAETNKGEVSTVADTDTSSEETNPPVSEVPSHIIPIKKVLDAEGYNGYFVDSYPEIPKPDIGEEYFTKMSTKELCEYYGLYNIAEALDKKQIIEITDENMSHGIYTLPDGSVYDINIFTFEVSFVDPWAARKFTVTVGKDKKFGQEYYFEVPRGFDVWTLYYNEEEELLFSVDDYKGLSIMFSGTIDEISSYDTPTAEMIEGFDERFRNEYGLPFALVMLVQVRGALLGNYIIYDENLDLFYNRDDNTYLDEETGEWIPADQWVFD